MIAHIWNDLRLLKVVRSIGPIDAKSVGRDGLLRWMLVIPLLAALGARLFLPTVLDHLAMTLQLDLAGYYPLIMSAALLLLTPNIYGMVVGFLLLDQRDDQTLLALRVTPLSLRSYLAYRIGMPMLISLAMTLLAFPLAGLPGGLSLLLAALTATPLAPLYALLFATCAANKVQGFALAKASSVLLLAPLLAAFTPWPWHLALGLVPTYWPVQLFWALQAGNTFAWFYLAVGLAYPLALMLLLLRRLKV